MYRTLIFCFVFFACGTIALGNETFRSDYTYVQDLRGWLKYHERPATFMEAFRSCNSEGAVLASPLNENLRLEMERVVKEEDTIFTGIHATITKDVFTSIEGIPLDRFISKTVLRGFYDPENQNECAIMMPGGTMTTVSCNETYTYICYRNETASRFNTECGTADQGYKFNQTTGSCYKFHTMGHTWRRAQTTCVAEGGHLAIINSPDEALVLKELFATVPNSAIVSKFNYVAAIGFLDWDKNGSWFTVNGETLEDAGFAGWAGGNPNNNKEIDGGQYCGGFFRWGELDDIWCDSVPFAFICEKSPDSLL